MNNPYTNKPDDYAEITPESLEECRKFIEHFYHNLAFKQQPLGKEFEKVLYDNLWDLYIRS